jgi:hypothetical protein
MSKSPEHDLDKAVGVWHTSGGNYKGTLKTGRLPFLWRMIKWMVRREKRQEKQSDLSCNIPIIHRSTGHISDKCTSDKMDSFMRYMKANYPDL